MDDLFIQGTDALPNVSFSAKGDLKITGRAIPEDAAKFFLPLLSWIKNFTGDLLNIEINLDYFNTSVSKQMLDLFKTIDNKKSVLTVNVKWMYEEGDDEMLESGEIYRDLLPRFHFSFEKYAELTN